MQEGLAGIGTRQTGAAAMPSAGRRMLAALLVFALLIPVQMDVAGLQMTAARLYLLVLAVPFGFSLLGGGGGRFTAIDTLMVLSVTWMAFTLIYHHGVERAPYAAMTALELLGSYVAARVLVRSAADYRAVFGAVFVVLLLMLPFAVYEMQTGRPLLSEAFAKLAPVVPRSSEYRNGAFRAGTSFAHPIHWGAFCALALAQAWYLYSGGARLWRVAVVVVTTYTSLSSAPLLGLGIQVGLIAWGRLTGNRWKLFAALFAFAYVSLELLSNRGPVILMIETLTLNSGTAWWRVYIWEYGSRSVLNYPFLGIGLNDWARPEWLAATVDNFWLLTAMRHGLPAVAFLVLALAIGLRRIVTAKGLSPAETLARRAYVVGFVALAFVLGTVHAWGSLAIWVGFYFGAGAWIYTGGLAPAGRRDDEAPATAAPRLSYTRFPGSRPAPAGRAEGAARAGRQPFVRAGKR